MNKYSYINSKTKFKHHYFQMMKIPFMLKNPIPLAYNLILSLQMILPLPLIHVPLTQIISILNQLEEAQEISQLHFICKIMSTRLLLVKVLFHVLLFLLVCTLLLKLCLPNMFVLTLYL